MTQSNSGWITALLEQYGTQFQIPFITFYGLTQPLLPAALVDSSLPIWKSIAIFRAAGWYFVIPFLLYCFVGVFTTHKDENRTVLIFVSLALAAWILISSLRAGGDQWDNPRYRTTFLPWIAILVAWVWVRLRRQKCPWFWRIVAIESLFVLVFLDWYLYRNYNFGPLIPFPVLMFFLAGTSVLILAGGYFWDKKITGKKHRRY
jgi:peptidoglycan/LPS O-acetylase OafA/YrhL